MAMMSQQALMGGDAAHRWLRAQSETDWTAAGLPPLDQWDPALLTAMRMIAYAASPMALMIGAVGIVLANDCAQWIFSDDCGMPLNGRSVLEVRPENVALYRQALERGLVGEASTFDEQPVRRIIKGTTRTDWLRLDFTPVVGSSGDYLAVLGTAANVTDYIERIHRLAEFEERMRFACEGAGMIGVYTHDVESGRSIADISVAQTYGFSELECRDGLSTDQILSIIHPDDRTRMEETRAEAIRTATPYRCRYRLMLPDGRTRWVVTTAKPVLDDEGKVLRLLGIVIDVTEQVEAVSALAESRFQFQTLTETLPQIVWSCDATGRHDYFSARWSEFTGIAAADVTPATWLALVDPEQREAVRESWTEALQTGKPYDVDYRFLHHSGVYRWLRVMALPIRDEQGQITRWFGTSTDVHDAYMLAEQREELARELERIATEDPLTHLLTRRAFIDQSTALLDASARQQEPISLLMLDIDHFKSINDTFGHPGGDGVLRVAGKRMQACLKEGDLVGRLGGEEFAILLPGCSSTQAHDVAERIRLAMETQPIKLDDGRITAITASIGVTSAEPADGSLDRMLLLADRALYEAKKAGRNRTVMATAEMGLLTGER